MTNLEPWHGTALDAIADGMSTVGTVGPLPDLTHERIVEVVRRLLAVDDRTRLRAVRRPGHRVRWDRSTESDEQRAASLVSVQADLTDFASAAPAMVASLDDRRPIRFFVGDHHLGVALDHGLIDGGDGVRLLSLVAQLATGGTDVPATKPDHRRPITAAAFEFFGRHPGNVRSLLQARRARPATPAPPAPPAAVAAPVLVPAFADVVIDRDETTALRAAGKQVGASWPAIAIELLASSLRSVDLPLSPEASIIVDLRRYLPEGVSTQANMCLGQAVTLGPRADMATTASDFNSAVAAGRPLAAAMLATVRSKGAPRTLRDPRADVNVGVAFLGDVSALFDLPFTGEPRVRLVSSPYDRRTVGATCFVLNRRLHLCLNFDAATVEPATVQAAVRRLADRQLDLVTG